MPSPDSARIGELLVEEGVVTAEDLQRILDEAGGSLSRALQAARSVPRSDLVSFLSGRSALGEIPDLRVVSVSSEALLSVPFEVAERHQILPLVMAGGVLCVAAADPFSLEGIRSVREKSGMKVKALRGDPAQVRAAVIRHYGRRTEIIPAPGAAAKPTLPPAAERTAPVPAKKAAPVEEAMPLISLPDESTPAPVSRGSREEEWETLELTPVSPASGPEHVEDLELEEVAEVLDALRVGTEELEEEKRFSATRLALEFASVHETGQPIPAVRLN